MAQKKKKQKQVKAKTPRRLMYDKPLSWNQLVGHHKYNKAELEKLSKFYRKRAIAQPIKRVAKKSLATRLVGKTVAKAIPGVGAAMIVHDVMRAGAKKGCIKRGGEWVGGKCKVAKKSRKKTSGPDPRFSKSRSKK